MGAVREWPFEFCRMTLYIAFAGWLSLRAPSFSSLTNMGICTCSLHELAVPVQLNWSDLGMKWYLTPLTTQLIGALKSLQLPPLFMKKRVLWVPARKRLGVRSASSNRLYQPKSLLNWPIRISLMRLWGRCIGSGVPLEMALGLVSLNVTWKKKATITAQSLKFALVRFITEVKKLNGDDYLGKTIYHIVICIQFHLECLGFAFKLLNEPFFKDLKFTVDNTMKSRVRQGIGLSVKQADILTATDEDLLWSLGFLGTSHPDQLLNTVIFCIGKGFALRAGKEHRALCGISFDSRLQFMRDCNSEIFLRYMEDVGTKTNKGGLKHRYVDTKTVDLYAVANPEHCPLRAIMKYMSLLPKNWSCPAFYLQPRKKFFGKAWYVNRPAGVNRLCTAVGEMCLLAELSGHYTQSFPLLYSHHKIVPEQHRWAEYNGDHWPPFDGHEELQENFKQAAKISQQLPFQHWVSTRGHALPIPIVVAYMLLIAFFDFAPRSVALVTTVLLCIVHLCIVHTVLSWIHVLFVSFGKH